jgi:sulfur relay (sulfurtransferase) complex TusBCD TusD component (DsrE family)
MDGVYNLMMTQEGKPFRLTPFYKHFEELLELGASIKICKLCKILRGVKGDNIPSGVEAEGIAELNQMILEADKVLSFIR